jgi:hypothetical protein
MTTLSKLRQVLPETWGPDTCDPGDLPEWRPGNPSRGQCGVTALVAHELLGGELLLGQVYAESVQRGVHYWNRLPDGTEVDLTRDQFGPAETVTAGMIAPRPTGPLRRCRGQHELLRRRVHARLSEGVPPGPPVQVALVLLTDPRGAVLLRHREDGQWGLPTRAEAGHSELQTAWQGLCGWHTEVVAYTGRSETTSAEFRTAAELAATDLSPTAAAVLHGTAYFRSCAMT